MTGVAVLHYEMEDLLVEFVHRAQLVRVAAFPVSEIVLVILSVLYGDEVALLVESRVPPRVARGRCICGWSVGGAAALVEGSRGCR